ncbi:hypothetical protein BKA64DRAFT_763499 [Cadophora sp. MPI-SDFR-AT-0126]|nr:hypothetical protein BKA64DRAFT_763499 [Leotiomycetes sp. MPI-SDFR-AT-0126]
MRVPDEEAEHRLTLVDLVLDIERPALICKKCGYALAPARSQVTTHLSGKHQTAPELRRGLTKLIRPLELPDPAELPLRPDDSQPHPHLKVHNGHVCRRCDYRTASLDLMTRHARQHIHGTQAARSAVDDLFYDVLLQTWVGLGIEDFEHEFFNNLLN